MPHLIGYVDDTGSEGSAHWQMLDTIRRFACGYGTWAAPTFSGTGTGTLGSIDTHPATVTETWTITCTDATTPGAEVWSVVGSVSGAQANATTGVAYDNGLVAFTIAAGATAFAVSDAFTLDTTQGLLSAAGQAWVEQRYDTSGAKRELILKGAGLSGQDAIYIGLRTYEDVSADYYNMSVAGFTGYVAGNTFQSQPGYQEKGICAHNQRIDYWLAVNGQRIAFGMKVGTPVYEPAYVGFFLPYATPGQYPYPLAVIGTLNGTPATRFSDTSHTMGFKGGRSSGAFRFVDGTWIQPSMWPWSNDVLTTASQLRDTGGDYLLPAIVVHDGSNLYGELDGVRHMSGFNNTVESVSQVGGTPVVDNVAWTSSERVAAILAAGGTPYITLQDVYRNGFSDYLALELSN